MRACTNAAAVTALVTLGLLACDHSSTSPRSDQLALDVVSGDGQTAVVGAQLAPLIVKVTKGGNPVPLQVLNFRVLSGGGSVYGGTELTDDHGIAQELWTLGTSANQPQRVEVRAVGSNTGAPGLFATFSATAVADKPATITVASGDNQTAAPGAAVSVPPAAKVTDQYGNTVAGEKVTFAPASGGGTIAGPATVSTGANGIATVGGWTLGPSAGKNTLTATPADALAGGPLTFTTTAVGPAGLTITNLRGDAQRQSIGTTLAIAPTVQLSDPSGHPVAGVTVTFSVTAGGGNITGATQTTDVNGIATVGSWALGPAAGANELQASFNTGVSRGSTIFVATATALPSVCDTAVTVNVNEVSLAVKAGQLPANAQGSAGRGFFEGTQVIFTGGPLYGTDPNHLIVGLDEFGRLSQDIASAPICVTQTSPFHHTLAQLPLTASASAPAGLVATQESFAFPNAPDNGYVLLRYVFRDTAAVAITNFYAGFVMDWDLYFDGYGNAFDDVIGYDQTLGIGEITEADRLTFPQMVGLVPIATSGAISFRGWAAQEDAIVSTRSGYFALLSGGIVNATTGPADIRELMGLGPLTIQPGQALVFYVAIVGGESQSAFITNVAHARQMAANVGFAP